MPRLFVALPLPEPLRRAVQELQSGLRNARWLTDDGLHLTLAFIGEVDGSAQRRIETALGEVNAPALALELHGLGCFPLRGAPRVLWSGVSPKAELVSLSRAVRGALRRVGLAPERRKFMPHVTIARFRQPAPSAALERYLGAHSLFRTSRAGVTSFHLFSSVLRPSGARYTIEATFPLTGTPPEEPGPVRTRQPATRAIESIGCVTMTKTFASTDICIK